MALKHATTPKVEETPAPAINVAPPEDTPIETGTESNGAGEASNGVQEKVAKDRMPWTSEKVRAVKSAVRENPGIAFDALLTQLRDGFLAEHLEGQQGKNRLLNLLKGIRNAEEKAQAAGTEFTPLPEVIMPQSMARPNLLEG